MPINTWILTDVENGIYVENFEYSTTIKGKTIRITKRRLYGGQQDGVDVVEIYNGKMKFAVCPTRGMGVLSAECDEVKLKWNSPAKGPVNPKFVPLAEPSGLGWLDGFSEWLVRCGLESNGAPEFAENGSLVYPLHGKIANIPAKKVVISLDTVSGEIFLTGKVEEARLFFKRLELDVTYKTV
ncbi:MAG: DUF4432 family protein, partial [Thermoguttaceae bacterium]